MKTLETKFAPPHTINRTRILADVFALFSNTCMLQDYPLKIRFAEEIGIDTGGVCRDMLAEFWQATFREFFDGSILLVPAVHAQSDMSVFRILGTILSHGYLFCNVLPTRITFPCMAAILLGSDVKISQDILLNSFVDYVSLYEQMVLKECFSITSGVFPEQLKAKLMNLLDRFGFRQIPKPENLKRLLVEAARFEFLNKPLAALSSFNAGIPDNEQPFWNAFSVEQLHSLYMTLTASPSKVLQLLEDPPSQTPSEERVFQYLQQFIGNLSIEEAELFLRFVSGSCVCPTTKLKVAYNRLSGLARRPIAHTCGYTLELSCNYHNYSEFASELMTVLHDENSWRMDAL